MKRFLSLGLIVLTGLILNTSTVNAQEDIYYVNDNGVSFTKNEYDFFSKMYYDGYQQTMTASDKAYFNGFDLNPDSVERVEYDESQIENDVKQPITRNTSHETGSKKLTIAKATSDYTIISVSLQWKSNPSVRSYDVIGARFVNTSKIGSPTTRLSYSGGTYTSSNIVNKNNGFGVSIKLPSSGSSIYVTQTYTVTNGGTVYASYQHAKNSVTLAQSKNYTIGSAGYGSVFKFDSSVSSKYDGMGGVYIGV